MKFGKLETIEDVDFSLPRDQMYFSASQEKTTIYTGATSWNNTEWKGILYPEIAKKANYIQHYSRQFNAIELNATHYRTPSDRSIDTWKAETPADFRFCPKVLQAISHRHDMLTNKDLVNNFIVQLSKLEEKLGQVFIQLPPYFKYSSLHHLDRFLQAWPIEMSLAVELRDGEIHNDRDKFKTYIDLLTKNNCTPLITDVAGRRDLMHMAVNGPEVFIRWVGNGLHPTDFKRLKEWKNRIIEWSKNGVKTVYFMLHEPENLLTPEIGEFFACELQNIQYLDHRGPNLIKEQPNLFS